MNEFLAHFPLEGSTAGCGYGTSMSEDELIGILDRGNPYDWQFLITLYQGMEESLFTTLEEKLRKYNHVYQADQIFKGVKKWKEGSMEGLTRTSARDTTVKRNAKVGTRRTPRAPCATRLVVVAPSALILRSINEESS
jgi:hypothetical protein